MQLDRQPFTILFFELILLPLGVFLPPQYEKYEKVYVSVLFLGVSGPTVMGELYIFPRLDSFIERLDVGMLTTSTISIVGIVLAVRSKRDFLIRIHKTMTESEFIDESFFAVSDAFLKQMLQKFGTAVVFCLLLMIVFPLLIATYTDAEFGSLPTLLYPAVYPWPVDTPRAYIVTLLFQGVSCGIPCFVVGGVILFAVYARIVLHCFHLTLIGKIEHIDDVDALEMAEKNGVQIAECQVSKIGKSKLDDRDQKTLSELRHVIRYHQFFNKLVKRIIHSIEPCVGIATVQFLVANICAISLVLMAEGNIMYKMKMINMMIISDMFFFLCCSIGDWLNHLNHQILFSTYEMKWYQRSTEFRKYTIIFMILLQKSFDMRMYKMVHINLGFVSTAFKNTYSVLQIIQKSHRK